MSVGQPAVKAAGSAGYSIVECLAVLALVVVLASAITPVTASAVDEGRARQAAGYIAGELRLARQRAAATGSAEALVFDFTGGRWVFRRCRDGNGNGVRRAELAGPDVCPDTPLDLVTLFPGTRIDRDASVPDPGGGAWVPDPVRFGTSDVASFSPAGTATAGTLYLLSGQNVQFAVRVAGPTGGV